MLTDTCRNAFGQTLIRKFRTPGLANSLVFIFLLLAFPALAAAQSCPATFMNMPHTRGDGLKCEDSTSGRRCRLSCVYDGPEHFDTVVFGLSWFKRVERPPNRMLAEWVVSPSCERSTDITTVVHPSKQIWASFAAASNSDARSRAVSEALRVLMEGVEGLASNCAADNAVAASPIDLKFMHPMQYLRAGTSGLFKPAGDLVATVPNAGAREAFVSFWIDPPTTLPDRPGGNLYRVLDMGAFPRVYHHPVPDAPPGRKYLGGQWTSENGEATINILGEIQLHLLARELLRQADLYDSRGMVSGTVQAGVHNGRTKRLERTTAIPIEFRSLAKILHITGDGRPDNTDPWRAFTGRVRVKRYLARPQFDFKPVERGFELMPGDQISIDGKAAVEIVWINGERVIASVPDRIKFADEEMQPKQASMILLSGAWESGFPTGDEQITSTFSGFGATKGLEALVEAVFPKGVKEGGELLIELYNKVGETETDFSKMRVMTRVRVRSRLLIDNTGDEVKILNMQGSPQIKSATGGIATLKPGNMVEVSKDGRMAAQVAFDPAVVASFTNRLNSMEAATGSKSDAKDGKTIKSDGEENKPDQRAYCNVRFNEKVIRTICEKGEDKGVPIDLYYYETPGVVSVPGVDGGRRLYNRFVRLPSVDHKDQSNVRWLHAYWVFSLGEWRTQGDFDVKVEVLGRVP